MKVLTADVVVIGAGSAGLTAWRAAKSHHRHVLLVEDGVYGTTCARVGCMPSKLLIAAAEAAHSARHAGLFGVQVGDIRVDGAAVMQRVRDERDGFVDGVLHTMESIPVSERLQGHACFINDHAVQVDTHSTVETKSVVIATGSVPAVPAQLRGLGDRLYTSDSIFEMQTLPTSLAVIGTGVIGLELGQALHRLGVRVTFFARGDNLAQLDDPELLPLARQIFGDELDIRFRHQLIAAVPEQTDVALTFTTAQGQQMTERFSHVLAATGRAPRLHGLGLQNTGLALDQQGIPVFSPATMQCGSSSIFIAGDVNNERPLLHEAVDQGRIAGDNAARFPDLLSGPRHVPMSVSFTDPQITVIGQTARALQGVAHVTGRVSFKNQGRSRVIAQNRGALQVFADRASGRFLGAVMIGPRAEHLAHLMAWACQTSMTVQQMLAMPFYHPVVEEGLRTALKDARDRLAEPVPEIEHCADCTPGI